MENYNYLIIHLGESSHQKSFGTIVPYKMFKQAASPEDSAGYFSIVRGSRSGLFSRL